MAPRCGASCGRLTSVLAAAALAPALAVGRSSGASIRNSLLQLASERIDVWYQDASHLTDPKERDGVTFRLSKEDKACGGDGVPLTFLEWDVDSARPVDVFNALADVLKQPQWDTHCGKMTSLGDVPQAQARGYSGLFTAKPLASREAYEWQVASANFTTEEFWIVYSTLENDELKQRKAPESGSVQMQNCLGAYRVRKNDKGGVHVINTQQVNSHPWPLSARDIAGMAWGDSVDWAVALRGVAQQQAKLGWEANRTVLPPWMLEDKQCAAAHPDTDLRDSLLKRAAAELARSDRGQEIATPRLPDGEMLHLWQRKDQCGGSGIPSAEVPVWQAEFRIPGVTPAEVFNVLVAKAQEASWNGVVLQTNLTGFHGGARGVHEAFKPPRVLDKEWESREFWEWQVTNHSLADGSYLVALTSAAEPTTDTFGDSVTAFQCLTAYQAMPADNNKTLVRMTSHVNPNVGILSRLSWLWERAGEQMLQDFARSLSAEAQRVASRRGRGLEPTADGDALELLSPPPTGQNETSTFADVLALRGEEALREFASLDLPQLLNASGWTPESFAQKASEVEQVFALVRQNATEAEAAAFAAGAATDSISVQLQGEVLSTIQNRVLEDLAKLDCAAGPGLPDIDGDKSPGGAPLFLIAGIAAAVLAVLCIVFGTCGWKRWRRYRRNRAAIAAATMLLSECRTPSNQATRAASGDAFFVKGDGGAPASDMASTTASSYQTRLPTGPLRV